jgi:hypothetical protein
MTIFNADLINEINEYDEQSHIYHFWMMLIIVCTVKMHPFILFRSLFQGKHTEHIDQRLLLILTARKASDLQKVQIALI